MHASSITVFMLPSGRSKRRPYDVCCDASLRVVEVIIGRFLDTWKRLLDTSLDLRSWKQHSAPTFFAAKTNICAQSHDFPIKVAAGMLLAETEAISYCELYWLHSAI
jgi:hypothetical protein